MNQIEEFEDCKSQGQWQVTSDEKQAKSKVGEPG
jgi:hypothetical protein